LASKKLLSSCLHGLKTGVGDDAVWDKAENALELALNNKGLKWDLQPGEGAFYGPKIEFSLKRLYWTGSGNAASIQVDFSMPGRLGATYIAEDGSQTSAGNAA